MSGKVAARIARLGITLPPPATPPANFLNFVQIGNLMHVAGQVSADDQGKLITGKLGEQLSMEEGKHAARQSIISFISVVNSATGGNLDRVKKIVKINVFVNSTDTFTKQPFVANGASDFLIEVFGKDVGSHARTAVGVAQLPFGAAVEIEGIVLLEEGIRSSL